MQKRFILLVIFAALTLWMLLPNTAFACIKGWSDFSKVSANGKYIFVMYGCVRTVSSPCTINQGVQADETLRAKYSVSGMYRNDGSTTPLWTVDWYTEEEYIEISSDGQHLVRTSYGRDTQANSRNALGFYKNGQEVKSYSVDDLNGTSSNTFYQIAFCTSTAWIKGWATKPEAAFDDTAERYSVETIYNIKYVFDLDGNIVKGSLPPKIFDLSALFVVGVIAIGIAILLVAIFWKPRSKTKGL